MTDPSPLLSALESRGAQPALAWLGEAGRVELSGHVLANWIIKSVNHLDQELALAPGDLVVLDLPPHWKRLVLAVAAWSLGARVELAGPTTDAEDVEDPRVAATADPASALADRADELLLLDAASLSLHFSGELPPLAHDWVQEVRGHADALQVPLPGWSGPALVPAADDGTATLGERPLRRPLPMRGDGLDEADAVLGALLVGRPLVGPADALPRLPAADGLVPGRPGPTRS
ncbi:TIGR03089 family protein [Brachybacterium hainanense]|uniref:TIGR03089 family protein n=1 Tax=Brachybacterium hainanense TaxID=1541174 RepID=A0ABV6RDM8_9MICO